MQSGRVWKTLFNHINILALFLVCVLSLVGCFIANIVRMTTAKTTTTTLPKIENAKTKKHYPNIPIRRFNSLQSSSASPLFYHVAMFMGDKHSSHTHKIQQSVRLIRGRQKSIKIAYTFMQKTIVHSPLSKARVKFSGPGQPLIFIPKSLRFAQNTRNLSPIIGLVLAEDFQRKPNWNGFTNFCISSLLLVMCECVCGAACVCVHCILINLGKILFFTFGCAANA